MKAVVAAFNQEKAVVGAFSVITNLWMDLFETLVSCAPGSNYQKSAELLGCGCVRFLIVHIVTDHLPRVVTRHTRD